jgi:hypothetical protein
VPDVNQLRLLDDTYRLQLPPLGQLQKCSIGHNNQGQAPSWHLSLVEVVAEESELTTYFAADRCAAATTTVPLCRRRALSRSASRDILLNICCTGVAKRRTDTTTTLQVHLLCRLPWLLEHA